MPPDSATAIAPAVLRRILEMAHLAPSVGFMQPWSFILIESLELRRRIKALFEERNEQERSRITDPERSRGFYEVAPRSLCNDGCCSRHDPTI